MTNERIEELKQKAMVTVRSHGAFGESERYTELNPDLFAELIVKECASFVESSRHVGVFEKEPEKVALYLKEYFGVE